MPDSTGEPIYKRALAVPLEAARRLGIDVDVAALAPARRRDDGGPFVPFSEYRAVLRAIFSDPRETLGIELARAVPVEAMGLWGFLLRSSPTFGDMLRRAERYMRVFFRFTRLTVSEGNDRAIVTCDHPEPSVFGNREQEVCYFLGQWLTLGRAFIGDAVAVEEVRMRWSGPRSETPFTRFFRSPIRFGSKADALVFDRRVLDLPLPERAPELTEMLESRAAAMIDGMEREMTFADRVREAMEGGTPGGAKGGSAVARRLCITKRTLRRRLAEAGLSFRQLRRELLESRAERMLRDGRLSIAEIAEALGYSDSATFHRAFRGWTGLAPGEWRQRERQRGFPGSPHPATCP